MLAPDDACASAKARFSPVDSAAFALRITIVIANQIRLARLAGLARLRMVGWLPWFVLVLWGVAAAAGEPLVLRAFGVNLQEQATWIGGALLAAVLLLSPTPLQDPLVRLATNITLLAFVALAQGGLGFALEALFGYGPDLGISVRRMLHFVQALLPAAAALSIGPRPNARRKTQLIVEKLLTVSCALVSVSVAVRMWAGVTNAAAVLAIASSLAACLLLVACSAPAVMIKIRT